MKLFKSTIGFLALASVIFFQLVVVAMMIPRQWST